MEALDVAQELQELGLVAARAALVRPVALAGAVLAVLVAVPLDRGAGCRPRGACRCIGRGRR